MGIRFLEVEHVIQIHADQIRRYGGSPEIHDLKLIESAVAMPRAGFGGQFLHQGIPEMAAAYLFHLVSNHGFKDGNKRIGTAAAIAFLRLNRFDLKVEEQQVADLTLTVACGNATKDEVIEWFRKRVEKV